VELGLVVWSYISGSSIGEIGGIHPHGNRKSPETVECIGVAGVHCAARVRKKQKRKGLDVGKRQLVIGDWRLVTGGRGEESAFGRVPERSGAGLEKVEANLERFQKGACRWWGLSITTHDSMEVLTYQV
jgi:hypothetical protein